MSKQELSPRAFRLGTYTAPSITGNLDGELIWIDEEFNSEWRGGDTVVVAAQPMP